MVRQATRHYQNIISVTYCFMHTLIHTPSVETAEGCTSEQPCYDYVTDKPDPPLPTSHFPLYTSTNTAYGVTRGFESAPIDTKLNAAYTVWY